MLLASWRGTPDGRIGRASKPRARMRARACGPPSPGISARPAVRRLASGRAPRATSRSIAPDGTHAAPHPSPRAHRARRRSLPGGGDRPAAGRDPPRHGSRHADQRRPGGRSAPGALLAGSGVARRLEPVRLAAPAGLAHARYGGGGRARALPELRRAGRGDPAPVQPGGRRAAIRAGLVRRAGSPLVRRLRGRPASARRALAPCRRRRGVDRSRRGAGPRLRADRLGRLDRGGDDRGDCCWRSAWWSSGRCGRSAPSPLDSG